MGLRSPVVRTPIELSAAFRRHGGPGISLRTVHQTEVRDVYVDDTDVLGVHGPGAHVLGGFRTESTSILVRGTRECCQMSEPVTVTTITVNTGGSNRHG